MEVDVDNTVAAGLRGYLDLIADALALTGRPYCLDLARPISAYLALDTRLPSAPHRDSALRWDERYGWAGALEDASSELTVVTYLGGDVLPSPRAVARFAFAFVADRARRREAPPALGDADRDAMLRRLARYARPAAGAARFPR